jgi:hypothetical protein
LIPPCIQVPQHHRQTEQSPAKKERSDVLSHRSPEKIVEDVLVLRVSRGEKEDSEPLVLSFQQDRQSAGVEKKGHNHVDQKITNNGRFENVVVHEQETKRR